MNMDIVTMHLTTAGCLGEEYNGGIIILRDMTGPACVNAGQTFIASKLDISDCENEIQLTKKIYHKMKNDDHNAFAFYEIKDNTLRYGSIKV